MIISVPLVPPSPNELRRKYKNAHVYRRLRLLWENELYFGASSTRHRRQLIEDAQTKRMRVQITIYHTKEFDPDNLPGAQKPILDALVNIHFLANDDSEHLELLPPVQNLCKSSEKRTIVSIAPI